VENHAKKIDGDLIAPVAHLLTTGPALTAFHHIVNGRSRGVRPGVVANGARTTDGDTLAHQAHGAPGLLRGQEVQRAELVFHPPTPPITQRAKIFEDSFFGWYALLHSPSSLLVWTQAPIVRCLARDLKAQTPCRASCILLPYAVWCPSRNSRNPSVSVVYRLLRLGGIYAGGVYEECSRDRRANA